MRAFDALTLATWPPGEVEDWKRLSDERQHELVKAIPRETFAAVDEYRAAQAEVDHLLHGWEPEDRR